MSFKQSQKLPSIKDSSGSSDEWTVKNLAELQTISLLIHRSKT